MPFYEFACDQCRQHAETYFGMNDTKTLACSDCGAGMRRVYSLPNLGGDLPSRWSHYDDDWEMDIPDRTTYDRELKKRGQHEYVPDPEVRRFQRAHVQASRAKAVDEVKQISSEVTDYRSKKARESNPPASIQPYVKEAMAEAREKGLTND